MPETPTVSKQGCPGPCLPLVVSRHRRSLDQRRTKGGDEAAEFPTILDGHRRRAERSTALAIVVHRTSKCSPIGWSRGPQVTPLTPNARPVKTSIGSNLTRAARTNVWCHLLAADCCPHWAANSAPESQGLASLDAKLTSNIERGEASDEALPADIDRPTPYPMNIDRCATELSIDLGVLHRQGLALSARGIS